MKHPELIDLYSDYLLTSFGISSAVGMSKMLDGAYSHDQISRFLAQTAMTPLDFWKAIKPIVRRIEQDEGGIALDDFIIDKPHSTENDIISYHFDHKVNRNVKGINVISFLYHAEMDRGQSIDIPVSYEIVSKPVKYKDPVTNKDKRRSEVTKNEMVRERLRVLAHKNRIKFSTVLWDTWYSSNENFEFVHKDLKKYFVGALKSNRKMALSKKEKLEGKFHSVSAINIEPQSRIEDWIKGLDFPVYLTKQVFTNKDGSTGELYLVSNRQDYTYEQQITIYQKRWKVEQFHKSTKQNASLAKSPTKYEVTQSNHIFCSLIAYVKVELLKIKHCTNHFAVKGKLYLKAIQAAFKELQNLKPTGQVLTLHAKEEMTLLAAH